MVCSISKPKMRGSPVTNVELIYIPKLPRLSTLAMMIVTLTYARTVRSARKATHYQKQLKLCGCSAIAVKLADSKSSNAPTRTLHSADSTQSVTSVSNCLDMIYIH